MLRQISALALALTLVLTACQLVTGVNGYEPGESSTGPANGGGGAGADAGSPPAVGQGGAGGQGGTGGTGGAGGGAPDCAMDIATAGQADVIWSRAFGDARLDVINDMAAAPDGSIFVVGRFIGAIFEGAHRLDTGTTHASGFVARLDPCGNVMWSKQIGASDDTTQYAYAASLVGQRVFVAGGHYGPFSVDNFAVPYVPKATGGALNPTVDIWIAALDVASGQVHWINGYGGPANDSVTGISATQNKVAISGGFGNGAIFGDLPIVVDDVNGTEGFVLTLDTDGTEPELATVVGVDDDAVLDVAMHPTNGDIYAAAVFTTMIDQPQSETADGAYPDLLLLHYGSNLSFKGLRKFVSGTNDLVAPLSIAATGTGIAVAGLFSGTLNLGSASLSAEGTTDGFVATFDEDLVPGWARVAGGDGDSMSFLELLAFIFGAGELEADGLGDVVATPDGTSLYVSGSCRGQFEVEPGVFDSCADQEVIVMRLDATNGDTQWSDVARGVGNDAPWGLALSDDQLFVAGGYFGRLKFGNDPLLEDAGDEPNAFVASYGP